MQVVVLKYHEDMITTKVSEERAEELLQFTQVQLSELRSSADSMAQHISQLEEALGE